ncbi:hypothetical protein [Actinomadura luteofluorescens]
MCDGLFQRVEGFLGVVVLRKPGQAGQGVDDGSAQVFAVAESGGGAERLADVGDGGAELGGRGVGWLLTGFDSAMPVAVRRVWSIALASSMSRGTGELR